MASDGIGETLLESYGFRLRAIYELGAKTLERLDDADYVWRPNDASNSIAVIVQHLNGNMLSRWTDFLSTDGDKPNRDREAEFTEPQTTTRAQIVGKWEEGWTCLLDTIEGLAPEDLAKQITIRGQALSVIDAINRQMIHYGYHTGQIVYIARQIQSEDWESLSIPRGMSVGYKPTKRD